jgi:hypothetical protein
MRSLITLILTYLVFSTFFKLMEKKNIEDQSIYFPEKYQDTISGNLPNNLQNDLPEEEYNLTSDSRRTICIRSLGTVDDSDLYFARNIIRDKFNFEVLFGSMENIDSIMYDDNGTLNSTLVCSALAAETKTIYITDNLLYDDNGALLRGFTSGDNKTIVVRGEYHFMRETIIHEIGHSLGLKHCQNLTCIMAINNDEYDKGDFCINCSDLLNNNNYR